MLYLIVHRHNGAALDILQPGKLRLHSAGLILSALLAHEEAVGAAQIGDPPVRIHAHQIVGTDIGLSVDDLDLDEVLPVEFWRSHGRGGQVEHAFAALAPGRKVAGLVFVVEPDGDPRQCVTDRFVVQIR